MDENPYQSPVASAPPSNDTPSMDDVFDSLVGLVLSTVVIALWGFVYTWVITTYDWRQFPSVEDLLLGVVLLVGLCPAVFFVGIWLTCTLNFVCWFLRSLFK